MLTIMCTLLRDVFEGGAPDDPRVAEWPPSWMRLFSALVSVAEPGSEDDQVLRLLETAPPPEISASADDLTARTARSAYVPTNFLVSGGGHTTLVARTNSERSWARVAPRSPVIRYRWPDLSLTADQSVVLSRLCRQVPYLGRSTSPATVMLDEATGPVPDDPWLRPRDTVDPEERFVLTGTLRSPFEGALDALRDAHEAKYVDGRTADPWEIGRGVDYGRADPVDAPATITPSPYQDLVVFRLRGPRKDGRDAARIAAYLRRALMSRTEHPPAALHGHHDGDVVQISFLGLPFVGSPKADGHLIGMALALPDLPADELGRIVRALPAVGEVLTVKAGRLGVLELERLSPLDTLRHPWTVQPQRWRRPSTTWTTATPMVLDRFLKRGDDVRAAVRQAVQNSRLPEPEVVSVSRRPLLWGAPDMRPHDTLRRPGDRAVKPYRHVTLRFPQPVEGPLVVGSMRHYGLGLCVPIREEGADHHA